MDEEGKVVDYSPSPPAVSKSAAASVALALLGVQVLWLYPAVFGLWVLLCNNGLILNPAANFAGASVTVAPSLVGFALAIRVLLRRRDVEKGDVALALCATIGALGFIVFVFVATAYDLLYPGPYPCG